MNINTRKPPSQRRLPDDGAAKFRQATDLLVAMGRQRGQDDATIRADLTEAFRQAVAGTGE